jgi:DNA-binding MarR family transcriptional regulator
LGSTAPVSSGTPLDDRGADSELPRLSYVVGRLDRALRQELDRRLEPFGLTWPQYTALSVLARTSDLSNAQLARRTYVAPQSMLEVISALERAGYVERAPSRAHRRVLETRMTSSGRAELSACDRAIDEMERDMLTGVPEERRPGLVADLMSCVRALHAGFAERAAPSSPAG